MSSWPVKYPAAATDLGGGPTRGKGRDGTRRRREKDRREWKEMGENGKKEKG